MPKPHKKSKTKKFNTGKKVPGTKDWSKKVKKGY